MESHEESVAEAALSSEAKPEASDSPKDGDFVAHCPHVSGSPVTWYWCEDTSFHKGTATGKVQWLCVCQRCESAANSDMGKVPLSGVAVYKTEPVPTLIRPPASV